MHIDWNIKDNKGGVQFDADEILWIAFLRKQADMNADFCIVSLFFLLLLHFVPYHHYVIYFFLYNQGPTSGTHMQFPKGKVGHDMGYPPHIGMGPMVVPRKIKRNTAISNLFKESLTQLPGLHVCRTHLAGNEYKLMIYL
jgi:hypothetical protein